MPTPQPQPPLEIARPSLQGTDRINFQPGTDIKRMLEKLCPTCNLSVSCAGPKSAGGELFADLYTRRDVPQAQIEEKASCFRTKEG